MLRLNLSGEPTWLDLVPGVRLLVAPLTSAIMGRARAAEAVQALAEAGAGDSELSVALAKEIAAIAVLDWEGIGDEGGEPLPVGPEAIAAVIDVWPLFEAFQTAYVAKGLLLDAEKNGSAPSPTGTSAAAEATARPARRAATSARRG